jgi:hypothetical protein
MKRDMDLVRDLMLGIEERNKPRLADLLRDDKSAEREAIVAHHIRILVDAGYLWGIDAQTMSGDDWLHLELTWNGHELLDTIRDQQVWSETKTRVKQLGNASLEVIVEIAKAYIKKKAKDVLGIEL